MVLLIRPMLAFGTQTARPLAYTARNILIDSKLKNLLPNIRPATYQISHRMSSNQTHQFIATESPFKAQTKFGKLLQVMGWGEADIRTLRRSAVWHYQACSDKLVADSFFKGFKLDDTMWSFYLIVQLHVWMAQVRSMREGPEGRKLRTEIHDNMWTDWRTRMSIIDALSTKEREETLNHMYQHNLYAMLSYDEGLLGDDKILAAALWRVLFGKRDVDPEVIELAVKYVRCQIGHLRTIGFRDWCCNGKYDWAPFPPFEYRTTNRKGLVGELIL